MACIVIKVRAISGFLFYRVYVYYCLKSNIVEIVGSKKANHIHNNDANNYYIIIITFSLN